MSYKKEAKEIACLQRRYPYGKVLRLALALLLAITLMPAFALSAFADEVEAEEIELAEHDSITGEEEQENVSKPEDLGTEAHATEDASAAEQEFSAVQDFEEVEQSLTRSEPNVELELAAQTVQDDILALSTIVPFGYAPNARIPAFDAAVASWNAIGAPQTWGPTGGCAAFARYAFEKVWGHPDDNSNTQNTRVYTSRRLTTVAQFASFLNQYATAGDAVRVTRSGGNASSLTGNHIFILGSFDSGSCNHYDSGRSDLPGNQAGYRWRSYEQLLSGIFYNYNNGNYSYGFTVTIKHSLHNKPFGSFDSATGGPGEISVRGWAIDRQDDKKPLSIDIYIGGPAGSGVFLGRLTANQLRSDVGRAYPGTGNNHGFIGSVKTTRVGTQVVYAYALGINGNNSVNKNVLLGSKTVTITAAGVAPTAPKINTQYPPPSGSIGISYNSHTLSASGTAPITWSIQGGTLPPGLALSSGGVISGTPTNAGTYSFTVRASNSAGSVVETLTIAIAEKPIVEKPKITTAAALHIGVIGTSYKKTLAASGTKTITWALASGSLPPGLKISNGGVISGSPTRPGTYSFVVSASNSVGNATKTFTVAIAEKPKITTSTALLHDGITGITYKKTLMASGTNDITWKCVSGSLPPGLKLSSAGVITGKPAKPGTYTFKVSASNSAGSASKSFTIKVNNPSISISYQTHVQSVGWQAFKKDGAMSGTSGKALRLEGIKINLKNNTGISGGIRYSTHVQSIGWQKKVSLNTNGKSLKDVKGPMSGTSGKALRLEAITIELTGDLKKHYDIYYRVHAQKVGWMGWARNGQEAGTAGHAYRLEGIQIVLVPKVGGKKPGNTFKGITTPPNTKSFIKK